MFHQYVLNAKSVPIDIDRAVCLMDKRIWFAVCADLAPGGKLAHLHIPDEMDRALYREHFGKEHPVKPYPETYWCEYCKRHEAKHGAPFSPDVRDTPL